MSTIIVDIPGYSTVREVGDRLGISASRVRQILIELRGIDLDVGYLVGSVRLLSPSDVAEIEKIHNKKRKYVKNKQISIDAI